MAYDGALNDYVLTRTGVIQGCKVVLLYWSKLLKGSLLPIYTYMYIVQL